MPFSSVCLGFGDLGSFTHAYISVTDGPCFGAVACVGAVACGDARCGFPTPDPPMDPLALDSWGATSGRCRSLPRPKTPSGPPLSPEARIPLPIIGDTVAEAAPDGLVA